MSDHRALVPFGPYDVVPTTPVNQAPLNMVPFQAASTVAAQAGPRTVSPPPLQLVQLNPSRVQLADVDRTPADHCSIVQAKSLIDG